MRSLAERLEAGLRAHGLKKKDLADKIGRDQAIITRILKGMPGNKHLHAICEAIGCEVVWLRTGTGPAPSWVDDAPASEADKIARKYAAENIRLREQVSELMGKLAKLEMMVHNRDPIGGPLGVVNYISGGGNGPGPQNHGDRETAGDT